MEYTINKMARLAGISTRTLRYYDEIGLLTPTRNHKNGYRLYGRNEVDKLQQILFFRELDVPLEEIGKMLQANDFDELTALQNHMISLLDKRTQLDLLIDNLKKTIEMMKGERTMSDKEKFEGFMKKLVDDNDQQYGQEIREKYGEENVTRANAKLMNMSREGYDELEKLTGELNETLKQAVEQGDPASELAQKACALHKQWLCFYWDKYSPQAHIGIAQMYVDDERFTAYYEKIAPGCAVFLRDAVKHFSGCSGSPDKSSVYRP